MKYTPDFSSRFRILKGGKISLVVSALVAGSTMSFAAPAGGQVTTGSVSITQSGSVTTINQSTNKASINWNSFSIAPSETVNFVQPSAQSVTLNRVVGATSSLIQGAMNANGQVFLLNPNGVLFANGSQINVGGLVASTLNITDANFQAGNYVFEGNSQNSIINMGTISANNGYVAMMGKTVQNEGTIVATMGNVQMASGEKISLNLNGNSLVKLTIDKGTLNALVENKGLIKADGGQVYLTTQALNTILDGVVNNTGVIEAKTLDDVTGKILLFAHGGTVNVGGSLDASALLSGNGGLIETSGKQFTLANDFKITTLSKHGKTGNWLLDPTDIYIVDGGADDITGSDIDADTITAALATTDVTLQADDSIYIQEALNINHNTLTLSAGEILSVEAPVNVTGTGGLKVEVAQNYTYADLLAAGDDAITPGGFIYNSYNKDVIAGALTVASTASYTYKFASDGSETYLTGVLNNGKLRVGNGWYNSVAQNGMLEQPWYYDNVTSGRDGWYRLTYSTYHLDQAIAIGGDGSTPWNLNGEVMNTDNDDYSSSDYGSLANNFLNLNSLISGITIDTSHVSNGMGTITATITLNSPTYGVFKLTNSYQLNANTSYIKTTTALQNISGADVTNARFWVGTRDDYIAESDSNYKTKGNIGSNGFKPITNQTDDAKAIIITENTFDSGQGAAVLFYSTTANTNTIINDCCSFPNVIVTNPTDSQMSLSSAEDGSYGIFLSLGNIANGQSKNLTWYYAAAPVAELNNLVTEVGQSSGSIPSTPSTTDTVIQNQVNNIVTTIVNSTMVTPPAPIVMVPVVPQQQIQTQAQNNFLLQSIMPQGSSNGRSFGLVGSTDGNTPVQTVSMEQLQGAATTQGMGEIRVPLANNSLVELVNGGLNLPTGVTQEFYVVDNSANTGRAQSMSQEDQDKKTKKN